MDISFLKKKKKKKCGAKIDHNKLPKTLWQIEMSVPYNNANGHQAALVFKKYLFRQCHLSICHNKPNLSKCFGNAIDSNHFIVIYFGNAIAINQFATFFFPSISAPQFFFFLYKWYVHNIFHNKLQVVSYYWFKFESNTKLTFLPQ